LVPLTVPPFRKKDPPVIAWSLEIHDLVLAKLVAGRAHDIEFTATALHERLVDLDRLRRGLDLMTPADRAAAEPRLERLTLHGDR
jgi:hypothetical protein